MLLRRRRDISAFWCKAKAMSGLQNGALLLDPVNIEMLEVLAATPRMTTADLARAVKMSGPAVRERVLRLEETGVIRGCRAEIEPRLLGYPVEAFIRVRPMPVNCRRSSSLRRKRGTLSNVTASPARAVSSCVTTLRASKRWAPCWTRFSRTGRRRRRSFNRDRRRDDRCR